MRDTSGLPAVGRSLRYFWLSVVPILLAGCGSIVDKEFAPNYGTTFDFRNPPACGAPQPECGDSALVQIRYLGAGGVFLRWKASSVLISPFFTTVGPVRALLGNVRWDLMSIAAGLHDLPLEGIDAILLGHSHYDHAADLPVVARVMAKNATLYVNRSGALMLASYPDLSARVRNIEPAANLWISVRDSNGVKQPIRFMALKSGHAPMMRWIHWRRGEVKAPWSGEWTRRNLRDLKGGTPYTFVVELLEDDLRTVRFRMYYQDAGSDDGSGVPPDFVNADDHGYDLAVLSVPSFYLAKDYPLGILKRLRPRHVIAAHYEDFFRSRKKPVRFVPLLTNARMRRFLVEVRDVVSAYETQGPVSPPCGPSASGWTVPMPGENLCFNPSHHNSKAGVP